MKNEKRLAAMRDSAVRWFLAQQLAEEEKHQGRSLTRNERVAFKCGLYRGLNFDLYACIDAAYAAKPNKPCDTQPTGPETGKALP